MSEQRSITISISTIIKIISVLLALAFLYLIRDVIALVFVAWFVASAFFPAVAWMNRKLHIPRALALASLYMLIGGSLLIILLLLMPVITVQLKQFALAFPSYINQVNVWWERFTNTQIPIAGLDTLVQSNGLAGNILNTIFGVFSTLLSILLVAVLAIYFTSQENNMRKGLLALLPNKYGPYAIQLLTRIQKRLGMWLRGQIILSLLIGSVVYVGLIILGVKYALLLALLATILEVIPFIGPVLAGAVAVLITLSSGGSFASVLLVVGLYVVVQQAENHFIVPKVLGGAVQINPLLIIIAILIGARVGGIVGALLAVPVAALLAEIAGDVWAKRGVSDD